MKGQSALIVDLSTGESDRRTLDDRPHYVGAVDFAVDWPDGLVLGNGPLAATPAVGSHELVVAGPSPHWGALQATSIPGAGLPFDGLGCSIVALRGRVLAPSLLVLRHGPEGVIAETEPLDPTEIWAEGGAPALLEFLLDRCAERMSGFRLLVCGPASAVTSFGSLLSAPVVDGRASTLRTATPVGGLGSLMLHRHGLCALAFGGQRSERELLERIESGGRPFLGFFREGRAALEQSTGVRFNPRLIAGGSLPAEMIAAGRDGLWFNASSIEWSTEERERCYAMLLEHLIGPPMAQLQGADRAPTGEPWTLNACRAIDGQPVSFEPFAALGPQLGIVQWDAAATVVAQCERLGLDVRGAAALVGWLMESLHHDEIELSALQLASKPRWFDASFDPVDHSRHNAEVAGTLLDGLVAARWAEGIRRSLRAGVDALGARADRAVFLGNRNGGELPLAPLWYLGALAPVPLPDIDTGFHERHFVAPRQLGRLCGERSVAALMLLNLGISALHRSWAEELMPKLIDLHYGTSLDWLAHHRRLARGIKARAAHGFWPTRRVVEWVARRLEYFHQEGGQGAGLDFWARRVGSDRASAVRALWCELNAGVDDVLD